MSFSRHLANTLELIADSHPEQVAITQGAHTLTWRDFDLRAARFANAMAGRGIRRGDVVAIAMYNCPEWLEAFYGLLKLRAIPANINYRYRTAEMLHLLGDSDARAVIYHRSLRPEISALQKKLPAVRQWLMVDDPDVDPPRKPAEYELLLASQVALPRQDRPADEPYLSYTGGTTGLPKGVLYRLGLTTVVAHRFVNAIYGTNYSGDDDPVEIARALNGSGRQVIALTAPPLMHSTGLAITAIPTLAVGGTVVLLANKSFDAHVTLREVERTGSNRLTIVGDAFARPLVQALQQGRPGGEPYHCSSLRLIVSSGAALSASTKAALLAQLPHVLIMESLGATEGVSFGVKVSGTGDTLETGRFKASPGVMLVDENFDPLPEQIGHCGLLAAPVITSGYFNDKKKNAETYFQFRGELYAAPGDYGRLEADGSLTLLGRGSGVINTGGEKVFAEEVEEVLKRLPGVLDCIVTGVEDVRFGQKVAALIQLANDTALSEGDITSHVKEHLAGYKVPRLVVFATTLPRGPNGKPDYRVVWEMLDAQ